MWSIAIVHCIHFQPKTFWKNGTNSKIAEWTLRMKINILGNYSICRFEIIVTFTGTSLATGHTTEERTSYLSNEIVWGHRFVNMVEYDEIHGEYLVHYDRLDLIEEVLAKTWFDWSMPMMLMAQNCFQVDTLLCSAQIRNTLLAANSIGNLSELCME